MLFEWRKIGLLLLGGILSGGCQTARVHQSLTRTLADNDPHGRSEFWYQLASCPLASNDDAFHGLLLYLDGVDRSTDYRGRVLELRSRRMLPQDFNGMADEAANRGTIGVALVRALHIQGGLSMRLAGPLPRYAVRSLEYRGIYPPCSPNQSFSGGEFVGVMQKAEEYASGNPADSPVLVIPGEIPHPAGLPAVSTASEEWGITIPAFSIDPAIDSPASDFGADRFDLLAPVYFDAMPSTAPAKRKAALIHLTVIISSVEGDNAEIRKSENDPWVRAEIGMVLAEGAEFRTGPKSSIKFTLPPDQNFSIDSLGTTKFVEAVLDQNKMTTRVELLHGRVREDLVRIISKSATQPADTIRIEQSGLEHDTVIQSPNSALALRGTKVSLFDQPSFLPEAVSLTGRAFYINTQGTRVPFGGKTPTKIQGAQTSAVQQAARSSAPLSEYLARTDFEIQELSIVSQRGGFIRGDVIVGDLHLSDFPKLPGSLDFVLQWSGGPAQALNDLNLAVFSPLNTTSSPDFVANPPFLVSLNPNAAASRQLRATNYPAVSKISGGRISANSVGPDGLELAYWGRNYPVGTYEVAVFNLLDAKPPPTQVTNPISYTIDVLLNGNKLIQTYNGSVGFLQTSPALLVPVPASTATPLSLASRSMSAQSGNGLTASAHAHPH